MPPSAPGKNRLDQSANQPLDPHSLIGSYFTGIAPAAQPGPPGGGPGASPWRGCVVAEPSPGTYLVQLAGRGEQRLVTLSDMTDWEFWDNPADDG